MWNQQLEFEHRRPRSKVNSTVLATEIRIHLTCNKSTNERIATYFNILGVVYIENMLTSLQHTLLSAWEGKRT